MILVFGAGGFIGTYLTDQLAADGEKVVATDVSEIAEGFYQRQGIQYHRVDITQRDEFDQLPTEGITAVVHLACVQPANVSEQKYDAADFIHVWRVFITADFSETAIGTIIHEQQGRLLSLEGERSGNSPLALMRPVDDVLVVAEIEVYDAPPL
jgi:dTDP-4-dehydrorhamnose reductase